MITMSTHRFLKLLAEKLESSATVKKVYGDPLEAQGKTVIPVAKISCGLGGGFAKEKTHDEKGREEERPAGQIGGHPDLPGWRLRDRSRRPPFYPSASRQEGEVGGAFVAVALLSGVRRHFRA